MPKVTLTNADGSTTDFLPQSYTDDAVKAALAANQLGQQVAPGDVEVDIILTDGTTKKFVPAA